MARAGAIFFLGFQSAIAAADWRSRLRQSLHEMQFCIISSVPRDSAWAEDPCAPVGLHYSAESGSWTPCRTNRMKPGCLTTLSNAIARYDTSPCVCHWLLGDFGFVPAIGFVLCCTSQGDIAHNTLFFWSSSHAGLSVFLVYWARFRLVVFLFIPAFTFTPWSSRMGCEWASDQRSWVLTAPWHLLQYLTQRLLGPTHLPIAAISWNTELMGSLSLLSKLLSPNQAHYDVPIAKKGSQQVCSIDSQVDTSPFQVFIKPPVGKCFIIWIRTIDSILHLKEAIQSMAGYPVQSQSLISGGKLWLTTAR